MLREILSVSFVLSGLVSMPAIAQNVQVCTPDLICTETGTPMPKGTTIRGAIASNIPPMVGKPESDCRDYAVRNDLDLVIEYQNGIAYCYFYPKAKNVSIVPRSDRDPRLPKPEGQLARACTNIDKTKEPGCTITSPHPVAVQDPSTPDGKNEPVYPGLPPAPKFAIVAQVTPQSCPSGTVLVDPETGKPFCG